MSKTARIDCYAHEGQLEDVTAPRYRTTSNTARREEQKAQQENERREHDTRARVKRGSARSECKDRQRALTHTRTAGGNLSGSRYAYRVNNAQTYAERKRGTYPGLERASKDVSDAKGHAMHAWNLIFR